MCGIVGAVAQRQVSGILRFDDGFRTASSRNRPAWHDPKQPTMLLESLPFCSPSYSRLAFRSRHYPTSWVCRRHATMRNRG